MLKLLVSLTACVMSLLALAETALAQTATPPTREELQIGEPVRGVGNNDLWHDSCDPESGCLRQ
jgi:hypothetical protein